MAEVILCAHKLPEDSLLRFELIEAIVSELGRQRNEIAGTEPFSLPARRAVHLILDDPVIAAGWMEQFS